MTATVPAALAVAGTVLMAAALFGPFRRPVIDADEELPAVHTNGPTVLWPALVEPTAVKCDVAARLDMAEALGALQSAWAETILRKAYETEPDPGVRSAISAALRPAQDGLLSSSQSLVT